MAFKDKQAMYDYNNRFQAEKYDRIQVLAKKEDGKAIRDAAAADGKSVSAYILEAVQMRMENTLHNDQESTMCNDHKAHESDTEALPDLLTPYARRRGSR